MEKAKSTFLDEYNQVARANDTEISEILYEEGCFFYFYYYYHYRLLSSLLPLQVMFLHS